MIETNARQAGLARNPVPAGKRPTESQKVQERGWSRQANQ